MHFQILNQIKFLTLQMMSALNLFVLILRVIEYLVVSVPYAIAGKLLSYIFIDWKWN